MGFLFFSTILKQHFVCLLMLVCFFLMLHFSSSHPLCHAHERSSLLQFKGTFAINKSASEDPSAYPKVASWTQGGSSDCCLWDGVECDKETGHVISLDLSSSFLHGNIDSNSSLFKLVHLERLSLADNDFNCSQIPTAIKQLTMLTYLNLSNSVFCGQIPSEISGLSNLSYLDMSFNSYGPIPNCILSGVIPFSIGNLKQLKYLSLQKNNFASPIPSSFGNLTQLKYLSLWENNFAGTIPSSFGNLTQLKYLSLDYNNFSGPIPSSFGNLTQLTELSLYYNHFSGPIPFSFSKLINLESLYLDENNLSGTVDFDMFLCLKNLTDLDLSFNNLSVLIRSGVDGTPPQFRTLLLSFCNLSVFPDFLRHQERMEYLDLQGNNIGGPIPKWLMNISRETMYGIELAENSLTGEVSPAICNFRSLEVLRLFSNKLVGELPLCLGNFSDSLAWLDLSNNSFFGSIPAFLKGSQLTMINLGHNLLQGKLPQSLVNCKKLQYLGVENNQLNDGFPCWLGSLPELRILVLRRNKFHGLVEEPQTKLDFIKLHIIDISYNNFTGKLPSAYIKNWKAMGNSSSRDLSYMTAAEVDPSSDFYFYFDLSTTITIKGVTRYYEEINEELCFIDLSNNNFGGEIPQVIGKLKGLHALDLNNNLKGGIPSALANLTALESLDLSQNELSGGIPQELTQLNFLEYFNVSHNRLAGPVPQANQFETFESSSYEGNAGLCGIPLPNKCESYSGASGEPLPSPEKEKEDHSGSPFQFGWKVVAIGYGCGFALGLFVGHVVITRKSRWFAMTFGMKNLHVRRKRKTPEN